MSYTELARARAVLTRVLEAQELPDLSVEDRRALERLAGIDTGSAGHDERPFWSWIRHGYWGAPRAMRDTFRRDADRHLDAVLTACGIPAPAATLVGRLLAPVSRDALLRGVTTVLSGSAKFDRSTAALVAAFAGFKEVVGELERLLLRSDDVTMQYLVQPQVRLAMCVLGFEEKLAAPEDRDRESDFFALRLARLEREVERASLDAITESLGEAGWTAERVRRFPALFARAVREGDDLSAMLDRLCDDFLSPLFVYGGDSRHLPSLVASLVGAGEAAALGVLSRLFASGTPPSGFLGALYTELAARGCSVALGALEARLAALQSGPNAGNHQDELVHLVWAIAVLRADGVSWLEGLIQSAPDDGTLAAAGALLVIARDDARHLMPRANERKLPNDVRVLETPVRLLMAGDAESVVEALFAADIADLSLAIFVFHRAASVGRRPLAPLQEALAMLEDPDERLTPFDRADVDPIRVVRWLRLWVRQGNAPAFRSILHRVYLLPPEFAAPVLEGTLARYTTGNAVTLGMERSDIDLALVELGCLESVERRVGGAAAALLRLHSASYPPGSPLPEPDRSVALGLLAEADGVPNDLMARIMVLLRGDPAFDALGSALLYRGAFSTRDPVFGGPRAGDDLRARLAPSDRLAAILTAPAEVPPHERMAAALTIMASPSDDVRALATQLLFGKEAPAPDELPLRQVQVVDGATAVRASILTAIGVRHFTQEELHLALAPACHSREKEIRIAAANALSNLGLADYVGLLVQMLWDDEDDVSNAAQQALRACVAGGGPDVVLLAIADPFEVSRHYGVSTPDLAAMLNDRRAEAMRLLLLGSEQRSDPAFALQCVGRRVVIAPVRSWPWPAPSGVTVNQRDFERLAMYLQVMLVDADTGSIVAEVGREATGEVLNAIFETGNLALLQVVWG